MKDYLDSFDYATYVGSIQLTKSMNTELLRKSSLYLQNNLSIDKSEHGQIRVRATIGFWFLTGFVR